MKNAFRKAGYVDCGIFHPNSVAVARYGALIRAKYTTNCDAHLTESLFQTRSKADILQGKIHCNISITVLFMHFFFYFFQILLSCGEHQAKDNRAEDNQPFLRF